MFFYHFVCLWNLTLPWILWNVILLCFGNMFFSLILCAFIRYNHGWLYFLTFLRMTSLFFIIYKNRIQILYICYISNLKSIIKKIYFGFCLSLLSILFDSVNNPFFASVLCFIYFFSLPILSLWFYLYYFAFTTLLPLEGYISEILFDFLFIKFSLKDPLRSCL